MPIYEIDGLRPVVHPTAFVHETAVLIGDVIVGRDCYIAPHASLRGDFGRLIVGDGANVQDSCTMHGFPGTDTEIEPDGHIGHGAVLHGCTVRTNAMVGMNAVVMDGAVVGESAFVAALTFVKARFEIPARTLVAGVPGRIVRELTDEEVGWKRAGTAEYQDLTVRSLTTMRQCTPLTEPEPDRARFQPGDLAPKYDTEGR